MMFKVATKLSKNVLFDAFIGRYQGEDQLINQVCMDWQWLRLSKGDGSWSDVLSAFRQGHLVGASESLTRDPKLLRKINFPKEVCEEICENAQGYPLSLVAIAEAEISRTVGSITRSIGSIAESDQWAFE